MKKWYPTRIPKPCHEDWRKMTSNQKGKFCDLCKKTVVDFTNKSKLEIQEILSQNTTTKVCGHFYKEQLTTVNIEIPVAVFQKKHSYTRMFALALLLTMGTTLLSCKSDGKIKKIETVEIIDSIIPKTKTIKKDSMLMGKPISSKSKILKPMLTKGLILKEKDTLNNTTIFKEVIVGEMITEEVTTIACSFEVPDYDDNDDMIFGFITVNQKPQFKNPKFTTKDAFQKQMNKFVQDNFEMDLIIDLGLKEGKHRIYTQFVIDKNGFVTAIKVNAPSPHLEKMVTKMIKKLPQFIPGKQQNKPVAVKYNLPINFVIED